MPAQPVHQLISHLFRHEAGKLAAVLTRIVGTQNFQLAEDLVQDTLLKALHTWKIKGTPENPSAWLYTVAKRKAIDAIRERKLHQEIEHNLMKSFQSEWIFSANVQKYFEDHEIEDSQLRMMFVCCHPSIPYESQVALTLKTLCGLSSSEIARSFLTSEETITKRLYRAREKIREERIEMEIPAVHLLNTRMVAILHTIYLLFNEGYNSSHPDHLIRHDLCKEAMRLALMLTKNQSTGLPVVHALMALMCFQSSREKARKGTNGSIILLKDQDRNLWNQQLIEKGNQYLNAAAAATEFSEYHLEAAIAACHANAKTFEATDWKRIYLLYDLLASIKPDSIVDMNKAIALGYAESPQLGLEKLKTIQGLESYSIYHAALGDMCVQVKKMNEAMQHYETALRNTRSQSEIDLLQQKITSLKFE